MFLLFLNLILRIIFILTAPVTGDEAMHYVFSRHLEFSYPEHPALTYYFIGIFTSLFGRNFFGLRFVALISVTLLYFVVKKISRKMGVDADALFSTPLFFTFGVLAITDGLYTLLWALFIYLFIDCVINNKNIWIPAGIVLGLCLNTKLLGFFLFPSILFYSIFFNRKILRDYRFYIMNFLALVLFIPAFLWNLENGFLTFKIRLGHGVSRDINFVYTLEFILMQLVLLGPVAFLLFTIKINSEIKKLLFSFFIPVLAFMLVYSLKARVAPHWAAAAYISGFLLVDNRFKRLLNIGTFINYAFISFLYIVLLNPLFFLEKIGSFYYRYKPQSIYTNRLNQIYGWKELSAEIKKIYDSLEGEKFIIGSHYSIASIIGFYTGIDTYLLEKVKRNGAYYNILEKRVNLKGKNAVIVFKRRFPWAERSMDALFEKNNGINKIEISIPGKTKRVFYYSIGYNFRGFEHRIKENIE